MRIAIVGAGAIGGYVGAHLANAGEEVTFIARGANLEAIRANGMRVIEDGAEVVGRGAAFEHPRDAGPQDAIVLAVKAHQVTALAPELHHMMDADTRLVTMQNGIPWWYFQRHGGPLDGTPIRAADPDGTIARAIDPARIVGTVVYPAGLLSAPGVVHMVEGRRISLGELDGPVLPRTQEISEVFTRAGLKAPVVDDIRTEIWIKVWGNLSFNPISALSHATLGSLLQFPLTRQLCRDMMQEAAAVAGKLGITFRIGIEKRIAGAERVGEHKTSMLQDVEHGRGLELEALIGGVIELGRLTDTPTPHIDAIYAVTSLLSKTLADANGKLQIAKA
jgi:2-dehydropantoate 2-reductase